MAKVLTPRGFSLISCPSSPRLVRISLAWEPKDPVASQHFPKPTTLGSSLKVFTLVLTAVECTVVHRCLLIQVHSNGRGFDKLNFCALREWTCACKCAVSVYFTLTSSVDYCFRQKKVQQQLTARPLVFIR